jgi:hypothetical protein
LKERRENARKSEENARKKLGQISSAFVAKTIGQTHLSSINN